jgi:hypothetical protein
MKNITLNQFDAIYVMYLPRDSERIENIQRQFQHAELDAEKLVLFKGLTFDDAAGFPKVGTRGCVMTFHAIFTECLAKGYSNVLVLQDDCTFSRKLFDHDQDIAQQAKTAHWDVLYLGHGEKFEHLNKRLSSVDSTRSVMLTHCCAYSSKAMRLLVAQIDESLTRPPGHPDGGPMYFDGYMNTVRRRHQLTTLCAVPSLAWQMSSKSNLTPSVLDRLPLVSVLLSPARNLRNRLRSLLG